MFRLMYDRSLCPSIQSMQSYKAYKTATWTPSCHSATRYVFGSESRNLRFNHECPGKVTKRKLQKASSAAPELELYSQTV